MILSSRNAAQQKNFAHKLANVRLNKHKHSNLCENVSHKFQFTYEAYKYTENTMIDRLVERIPLGA